MKKKSFLILLFVLLVVCGQTILFAQFHLIGDAQKMNGDCIQLTPDQPYSEGIAYHQTKINLNNFFEIEFDIYLGKKDEGADGITFVIHNDPREFEAFGTYGECMGYGRWRRDYLGGAFISPSVAIEFDTYRNFSRTTQFLTMQLIWKMARTFTKLTGMAGMKPIIWKMTECTTSASDGIRKRRK